MASRIPIVLFLWLACSTLACAFSLGRASGRKPKKIRVLKSKVESLEKEDLVSSESMWEADSQRDGLNVSALLKDLALAPNDLTDQQVLVDRTRLARQTLQAVTEIKLVQDAARARLEHCVTGFADGLVVANFMDMNYMQTAAAWEARMHSMGYKNLVVYALDDMTLTMLKGLWRGSDTCIVPYTIPETGSTKIPPLVGLAKFDAMELLIRLGRVGIVTEADVFWVKDPAPALLKKKAPIVGATTVATHSVGGINIGFVRVRPTNSAVHFLGNITVKWYESLIKNLERGGVTLEDQNLFNKYLVKSDHKLWSALDTQEFQLHQPLGFYDMDCDKTTVVHFTFMPLEQKVRLMKNFYDDTYHCKDLHTVKQQPKK